MKAETARLLRAVLRLVEDDVRELADTVVEIDEREAAHYAEIVELRAAVEAVSADLAAHAINHQRPQFWPSGRHSVKVS